MKYMTTQLLKRMRVCSKGIEDFEQELKKRNLSRISIEKCLELAIDIESDDVPLLINEFGKYLTDSFTCDWNKLEGCDWMDLLKHQPQFHIHCDWKKLNGFDWCRLLRKQPQFHIHCDWNKLNGWDWELLLRHQPQFHEHCDWNKLNGSVWVWLLIDQPQFHIHCNWSKLNGLNWRILLEHHPQFEQFRPST